MASNTAEIIKAVADLIKTFFEGFGVIEAVVLIIILGLSVAIFRPEALVASYDWLEGLIPLLPGGK